MGGGDADVLVAAAVMGVLCRRSRVKSRDGGSERESESLKLKQSLEVEP